MHGSKLAFGTAAQRSGGTPIGSLADALVLDAEATISSITTRLRSQVSETLRRRGVVLGMSGGIDSSVCAALAVRALGPERVFAVLMPERESGAEDTVLAERWARCLGIAHRVEDISALLEACGAYRRRDTAIRTLVPEYGDGWRCKVSLGTDRLARNRLSVFFLTVEAPDGTRRDVRLNPEAYREVIAATSFKQRTRKMLEYYHADRLHFAVLGTPNRLEYELGFFVKGGDGLADVKPIAHLYKSQVYQLASALGVPEEIVRRTPSTGTYPLQQGQDEFYFTVPLPLVDRALFARDEGLDAKALATDAGLALDDAVRILRDIDRKRSAASYLQQPALLAEPLRALD